ncbi:unnamed protein product [Hydatigera taeniaeformis]|uniref:Fibronectin type-III domain-containing protein n=1 Tax=Hydatigena taeniaeformis TaxID=6205 RepID=A0A0R3XD45_HYDTA|nr:unnamed protein product [Hydatigera taeniaeformis]
MGETWRYLNSASEMLLQVCLMLLVTFILDEDIAMAGETSMKAQSLAPYFHLKRVDSDYLQITWDIQSMMEHKVTEIKVVITSDAHSGIYGYATEHVSTGEVTIDELEPYTLYEVEVKAMGNGVHHVYSLGPIETWPIGKWIQHTLILCLTYFFLPQPQPTFVLLHFTSK